VITLGNHVWRRPEIGPYLAESERVVRPANVSSGSPGRALTVGPAADGSPVAVINLLGHLFIDSPIGPFELVDDLVEEARKRAQIVLVDFHAEATSEKVALARWLDGRVTAVIGTHTHVQTNDARVLPGGTATISDAGMTGPHDSVIGVQADLAIARMRTGMPVRFKPAEGGVRTVTLRRASRFASRHSQNDDEPDQDEVAREHEPGRNRVLLQRQAPVAIWEPELRQHECDGEHARGGKPTPPTHERHERQ
jgi:metallophosphoesterase (TIGR00282 family)